MLLCASTLNSIYEERKALTILGWVLQWLACGSFKGFTEYFFGTQVNLLYDLNNQAT